MFDDGNKLMNDFSKEVMSIISVHERVAKHDQSRLPRMTVIAASKYTPTLEMLLPSATCEPTEIICCSIEAAIRGNVMMVRTNAKLWIWSLNGLLYYRTLPLSHFITACVLDCSDICDAIKEGLVACTCWLTRHFPLSSKTRPCTAVVANNVVCTL